jgi:hypothetical protein
MKYIEQKELVERYNVLSGQNLRVNCPVCGGKKTLSVSKFDGRLVWNCFKASCEVGGKDFVGRNNKELKNALSGKLNTFTRKSPEIPSVRGTPIGHSDVENYLEQNNCMIAYNQKLIRIEYAPAEKRVLFYNQSNRGCVGRSLVSQQKPKWKAYGDTTELFTVGAADVGVIVEDAASACAVAATGEYSGICLLGTHLNREQKRTIVERHQNVIISLDKDASRKSIYILQQLRGLVRASVKFLEGDLKQYGPKQIMEILK